MSFIQRFKVNPRNNEKANNKNNRARKNNTNSKNGQPGNKRRNNPTNRRRGRNNTNDQAEQPEEESTAPSASSQEPLQIDPPKQREKKERQPLVFDKDPINDEQEGSEPESPDKASDETQNLRNVQYMASGYNIMFGNPNPSTGSIDPGFVNNPIFDFSIRKKKTTFDNAFFYPDKVEVLEEFTCDLSFSTKMIADEQSNKKALSANVEVSGGFGGLEFSANVGYNEVKDKTEKSQSIYTLNQGTCALYRLNIDMYSPPKRKKKFKNAVEQLPVEYDKEKYMRFIGQFGTHFITEMKMGARYGLMSEFSRKDFEQMESRGVDIGVGAKYSGLYTAGVKASVNTDDENFKAVTQKTMDKKIFSIGSKPPADGNMNTWAAKSVDKPMPIHIKLEPMYTLIKHKKKSENLKRALEKDYCPWLLQQGKIRSCDATTSSSPSSKIQIRNSCRFCTECEGGNISEEAGKHDVNSYGESYNNIFNNRCFSENMMEHYKHNGGVRLCCQKETETRIGSCRYCRSCGGHWPKMSGWFNFSMREGFTRSYGDSCSGSMANHPYMPTTLCCTEDQPCVLSAGCGGNWPHETGRMSSDRVNRIDFNIKPSGNEGEFEPGMQYYGGVKLCCRSNGRRMKRLV